MKQRKSFIEKVKQEYAQHKNTIQRIFVIVIGIALFATGYLISSNFLQKPISNSEFEFYEQVARDVYEQGDKVMYEVPDGVSLQRTNTNITISSAKIAVRGQVIATLQNGELVFTRDAETRETIVINSIVGILFVLVGMFIVPDIDEPRKKRK